jgi:hypothetical protein
VAVDGAYRLDALSMVQHDVEDHPLSVSMVQHDVEGHPLSVATTSKATDRSHSRGM